MLTSGATAADRDATGPYLKSYSISLTLNPAILVHGWRLAYALVSGSKHEGSLLTTLMQKFQRFNIT